MATLNPQVDQFMEQGCGRCPLGGTPDCKTLSWTDELARLREIVLECGLTEEVKWSVPCYTHEKRNIVLLGVLKDCRTLNFLKGALLSDPKGLLEKPGENSQSARYLRFTSTGQIRKRDAAIRALIREAIDTERSGKKVDFKAKHELIYPDELLAKFDADPDFKAAFEALTPGRQRGFVLHFTGAKQSKTRASRIEKCVPKILQGKGPQER